MENPTEKKKNKHFLKQIILEETTSISISLYHCFLLGTGGIELIHIKQFHFFHQRKLGITGGNMKILKSSVKSSLDQKG